MIRRRGGQRPRQAPPAGLQREPAHQAGGQRRGLEPKLEDYIYLDIIPSGNQPAGRGYTDRSILVDAAIHTKGESNLEYLQISQELDDLLRPVFRFTDKGEARAVTIPDLAFNIVDIRERKQPVSVCRADYPQFLTDFVIPSRSELFRHKQNTNAHCLC